MKHLTSIASELGLIFLMVALVPTLLVVAAMAAAAYTPPGATSHFRRKLNSYPLSFWIMTWFLIELVVLTVVGTFFRGPGWSWVLPWRG